AGYLSRISSCTHRAPALQVGQVGEKSTTRRAVPASPLKAAWSWSTLCRSTTRADGPPSPRRARSSPGYPLTSTKAPTSTSATSATASAAVSTRDLVTNLSSPSWQHSPQRGQDLLLRRQVQATAGHLPARRLTGHVA